MTATASAKPLSLLPLETLLAEAAAHRAGGLDYAGDIAPALAHEYLAHHGGALVDVRTQPEWQFVGLPDLSGTPARLVTVSWKTYPGFSLNPQFGELLAREEGIDTDTPLFFICRSGGRSLDAAVAMKQAGYRYCFNVAGGFEGEPDAHGRRGVVQGWQAAGLPWRQG